MRNLFNKKQVNWGRVLIDFLFLIIMFLILTTFTSCETQELYEYEGIERNYRLEFYGESEFDNIIVHVLNDIDAPINSWAYSGVSNVQVYIPEGEGFAVVISDNSSVEFSYALIDNETNTILWTKESSCIGDCNWSEYFD